MKSKPDDDNDDSTPMRKFNGYVSVGLVGCRREFSFEVDPEADDDEIEECAREAMFNVIEWGYSEDTDQ